jgi:hypothetical protein
MSWKLLAFVLAMILAVMVVNSWGVSTSCNDPDVALGGCNDN